MLEETPHKLQIQVITPEENDEYGRPIMGTGGESWQDIAECFCHDNSRRKERSINGERWVYRYNVVYEGENIPLGSHVRCLNSNGKIVGEGEIMDNAECHSEEFEGRCEIWI
jgi:hypothetical protein